MKIYNQCDIYSCRFRQFITAGFSFFSDMMSQQFLCLMTMLRLVAISKIQQSSINEC